VKENAIIIIIAGTGAIPLLYETIVFTTACTTALH
jgi:hypothetical protein